MFSVSPKATRIPSIKLQGQSIANCMRGPRNRTWTQKAGVWISQISTYEKKYDLFI